jgi:peptidoglycan/LPS O-acetylase OafA/YrhL
VHRREEIEALTGLRFVAAAHVLVYHAFFTFDRRASRAIASPIAKSVIEHGYVGVNLFFVLSGFVLGLAYVDARGSFVGRVRDFWRARFARIYPLHVIGLLLALPLFVLGSIEGRASTEAIKDEALRELAVCATLVQAWLPRDVFDLNGPAWSLSVEAFFYTCFPLVVFAARPIRRAWPFAIVVTLACVAAIAIPLSRGAELTSIARASDAERALLFNPLLRLPDFVAGFVAARVHVLAGANKTKNTAWDAIALLAIIAACVACATPRVPLALLHNGALDVAWVILFVALARGRLVSRALAWRPLVVCGRASFALYVIHKPLYFWIARFAPHAAMHAPLRFVILYACAAIIIAVIVFRFIEEPARRALAKRRIAKTPRRQKDT